MAHSSKITTSFQSPEDETSYFSRPAKIRSNERVPTSPASTSSHSFYGKSSFPTAFKATTPRTLNTSSSSHMGDMGIKRKTGKAVSAAKAGNDRVASSSTSTTTQSKKRTEANWSERQLVRQKNKPSLDTRQITPTKKRIIRPSLKVREMAMGPSTIRSGVKHAIDEDSDTEGSDEVEQILIGKARGPTKKKTKLLVTPDSTPTKSKNVTKSSLKEKRQAKARSRAITLPSDGEESDEDEEEIKDYVPTLDSTDDDSFSEDEIDLLGSRPSTSTSISTSHTTASPSARPFLTPSKPKPKPKSQSKSNNKPSSSSTLVTPSTTRTSTLITPTSSVRSSARVAGLPIERSVLKNAPKELRAKLVGSHMEDFSEDSDSEEDDDSEDGTDGDKGENMAKRNELGENSEDEEENSTVQMPMRRAKGKRKAFMTATTSQSSSDFIESFRPHSTLYSPSTFSSFLSTLGQNIIEGSRDPISAEGEKEDYLPGYETWEKSVRYAMRNVVEKDVGNCLILLGQRGVGKTLIIDRAISLIRKSHEDDFILVRINGLVETTDRLALKSIARQLREGGLGGIFDEEDEETGSWNSNASTMSTLLKMLEPSASTSSSPSKSTSKSSKPPSKKSILMIVDEFDLFALHPRQAFLYSLLDIVQGNRRGAGMGVFGISSRTDCLSILEKRVRSRCQSQVYQVVLPNSWDDYNVLIKNFLRLSPSFLESNSNGVKKGEGERFAEEWNEEVKAWLEDAPVIVYFDRLWKVYGCSPAKLSEILSHMFYRLEEDSKDQRERTVPKLSIRLLPEVPTARYQTELLRHLSILELTVCIAAMNTLSTGVSQSFTTEMLWSTYTAFAKPASTCQRPTLRAYSKEEFCFAIDSLRKQELILPTTGKPTRYYPPSYNQNYKHFRFAIWEFESVKKIVAERRDVMEDLRRWSRNLDIRLGE